MLDAIASQRYGDKLGIQVFGWLRWWGRAGFVERLLISRLILSLNPPRH
ncbi:hypothetical protein MC7420_2707 [Coleofasciculus chthonoplastes PCC 7420]|uniref:Uncharacterized protein n=1 Tax=Coleofasciculus chthonoplastes PCC 7420 TaxID=118168 RepID=B4VYF7_9CYAN|nr:hypothetical protein MC7420_2707 [Coleofasciculus chthonoplastes PCC 7420]